MKTLLWTALIFVIVMLAIGVILATVTPSKALPRISAASGLTLIQGSCTVRPGGKCVRTRCKGRNCI